MTRVQGTDYTKKDRDELVIRLPNAHTRPRGAWQRLKRALGAVDDGFELSIRPPTKRVHDELAAVAGTFDDLAAGKLEAEDVDLGKMLATVACAMSNNSQGREVTPGFLESIGFDLVDVGEFIGCYIVFMSELVEAKN